MNKEGWRQLILDAAYDSDCLDPNDKVYKLALYLEQVDEARQVLRDKGYGVSGTPILEQVADVPCTEEVTQTMLLGFAIPDTIMQREEDGSISFVKQHFTPNKYVQVVNRW